MKCPKCSSEMIQGKYKLKGTLLGFLFFGFSQKELYFLSDDYEDKLTLGLSNIKKGFYCSDCDTQVILKDEHYEY